MHKNDGASVTYFMFQLGLLSHFWKKQHSSIMTKFINNLCLYLLHAVFSLVKPAISNTYLILMGFFQVFLQLHSSFKSKQQASHSSITPKFLGSMYFSAKGDAPSPMQIPFLQIQCLLASCLLCAYCCCCLHSTCSTYLPACMHYMAGRPAWRQD